MTKSNTPYCGENRELITREAFDRAVGEIEVSWKQLVGKNGRRLRGIDYSFYGTPVDAEEGLQFCEWNEEWEDSYIRVLKELCRELQLMAIGRFWAGRSCYRMTDATVKIFEEAHEKYNGGEDA